MGWIRHHAIVVTGTLEDERLSGLSIYINKPHAKAVEIFGQDAVTPLQPEQVNGYSSFCVLPDGSKEGWEPSDEGDRKRDQFVEFLKSTGVEWVEVAYGRDVEGYIIRSCSDAE